VAHIFISYAREDAAFARELCALLERVGRDVWVDWQGLAPTVEWMAEIYAAIDAADAYLFVITPDSVSSQVCQLEIARAVAQKKRLVPVVRRVVDEELVPAPLRPINWIFYRETDPPDVASRAILDAIELDLDRARMHSRLLVRAKEWDSRQRDASMVLRGSDLREAERWLDSARDDHPPQPTSLHTQFILASRKAATTAQRRLLVLVSGALIVASALAFVAYRAERRATFEQHVAEAGQLSAVAINNLNTDPELALLLALEAASRGRGVDGSMPVEVQDAVHRVIQAARAETVIPSHGMVKAVAFSPDGKVIASVTSSGVTLLDAISGRPNLVALAETSSALSVAFSRDGTRIAAGGVGGELLMWDVSTGRLVHRFAGHQDAVWSLTFSPDGRTLVSTARDGTVRVWDAVGGRLVRTLVGHKGQVFGVAFTPDGALIGTVGEDTTWRLWDATTGREVRRGTSQDNQLRSIAFSPNGTEFATAGLSSTVVSVWSVTLGRELRSFDGHTASIFALAYSPDGKRLLTASMDKTARIWDARTGETTATLLGHRNSVICAAFSPDNEHTATGSEDETLRIWTAAEPYELPPLTGHTGMITELAFAPDGDTIATASTDNTARLWDVDTGRELLTLATHHAAVNSVAVAPDGRHVATGSSDGSALIVDVATGRPVVTLSAGNGAVNHVAFSGDGSRIATALEEHTAVVWDVTTGGRLSTIDTDGGRVVGTDLNRNGTRLAVSLDDQHGRLDTAEIWDVASRTRLVELSADHLTVNQVLFNPDATRVITVGTTPPFTTTVWDSVSGSARFSLSGHRSGVLTAAISRDETYIATAGYDALTHVWDSWTGAQMFTLGIDTPRRINSVAFSPDNRRLATGAADRIVRFYALDAPTLITIARAHVTRELTKDECQRYVHQQDCRDRPAALVLEGRTRLAAGDRDGALGKFRAAAAADGVLDSDAAARRLLVHLRTRESRARAQVGDLPGVTTALEDIKRFDPAWRHDTSGESSRLVSASLVRQAAIPAAAGDERRSLEILRRATALDPKSLEAHRALENALIEAKQYAEATKVSRGVLALSPTVANRVRLADALRLERHYDEALAEATRALADDPRNESAHCVMAAVYSDRHDVPRALAELDSAIALQETVRAYRDKARLLELKKDYRAALAALDQARHLDPNDASLPRRAGAIDLEDLHDFDAAYRELQTARSLAASDAGVQADFAEVAMAAGRFDEARSVATSLLSMPPSRNFTTSDYAAMRFITLVVLEVTGQLQEAAVARAAVLDALAAAAPYENTWNYEGTRAFLQRTALDAEKRRGLLALLDRLDAGKKPR